MKKFSIEDQNYFDKRDAFAKKYDDASFWFIADNWPLLSGSVNIARFLAIYDLVKKVIDLPGHFCDLGCWNGTSLTYIAKILDIFRNRNHAEVIGFDSFQGLQTFDENKDENNQIHKGTYHGDLQLLEDVIELHGLTNKIQLVKGNIEETLPMFLEERTDIRFSFVYLDVDLYSPAKLGIELLYPKLLKGGIMVFDEYNTMHWPGETSAVHDVLGQDVHVRSVPFTRQPTGYIIK